MYQAAKDEQMSRRTGSPAYVVQSNTTDGTWRTYITGFCTREHAQEIADQMNENRGRDMRAMRALFGG